MHAFNVFLQFPVQTELGLYIYQTNATQAWGRSIYAVAYKLAHAYPHLLASLQLIAGFSLRKLAGFLVCGHARLSQVRSRCSFWLSLASQAAASIDLHLKEAKKQGAFL